MILTVDMLCIMGVGSILALIYCGILVFNNKYDGLLEPLNSKEYPLCETYNVGFYLINKIPRLIQNAHVRSKRQYIEILHGTKYADYYLRINSAQSLSLSLLVFVLSFFVYGLTVEPIVLVVMFVMAAAIYYYYDTLPKAKVEKRTEEISLEFANVVSKLVLLINAGMIVRDAWEKVAYTGKSDLYIEMQDVVEQMNNGVSESDALTRFATRCTTADIKKFTSMLIQGMNKGNRELTEMMKEQSREIWNIRRNLIKQQGEKAASKLLIPMCIMFIGILIMIIVPIFSNLG